MRSAVVLPQPDGPRITTVSPRAISKLTGSSARVPSAKTLPHASTTTCAPVARTASPRAGDAAGNSAGQHGGRLHQQQQRNDHEEEKQRVGAGDLEPHRGVAVGEPDRQRLGERRVQHPGQIELADGQRDDHERAGQHAGADIGQDHVLEPRPRAGAQARGAFLERTRVDGGEHRHDRAHHER